MKAAFMPRSRGFVGRLSAVAQTLRALRPERRGGCAEAPGPAGSEGSLRDRSGAACGAAARELPAELGDASRKLLSSPALISKRAVLTSNVIFFFSLLIIYSLNLTNAPRSHSLCLAHPKGGFPDAHLMPSAGCAALCSAELPRDPSLSSAAAGLTPQAQSSPPFTAMPSPLPAAGLSTGIVTHSVCSVAISSSLCSESGA